MQVSGKSLQDSVPWEGAGASSLGHALLEPTLIYVKRLLALTDAVQVKASNHPIAMLPILPHIPMPVAVSCFYV